MPQPTSLILYQLPEMCLSVSTCYVSMFRATCLATPLRDKLHETSCVHTWQRARVTAQRSEKLLEIVPEISAMVSATCLATFSAITTYVTLCNVSCNLSMGLRDKLHDTLHSVTALLGPVTSSD